MGLTDIDIDTLKRAENNQERRILVRTYNTTTTNQKSAIRIRPIHWQKKSLPSELPLS
jgi:hypothetical protein